MKIRVRTDSGPEIAQRLAEFEAEREVFLSLIFVVPEEPGFYDYCFTTGRAWCYEDDVVDVEFSRNV